MSAGCDKGVAAHSPLSRHFAPLTLAVDLGRRGIACTLVERRAEPHHIAKGQLLTHRTIEHFYFDAIDELRAARLMPRDYPIGEITTYETLNGEHWHAPAGRELVRPYFLLDNDRMPQYQLEGVLRNKLSAFPHVRILPSCTAKTIEQDSAGVRVHILRENGDSETLECDYAVGCDGSHSIVREQSNIARTGSDFDQLMMLAVFRSAELNPFLQRFPQRSTFRVVQPEFKGYWQFFGRVDHPTALLGGVRPRDASWGMSC
jgi:2-polyprenyl-6-methoxyphenol hydroxylase-like FAD-dependent oxidoreductase